jgi:hypothetical protein
VGHGQAGGGRLLEDFHQRLFVGRRVRRFGRPGFIQRLAVQAVFLEKVVQSRQTDAKVPSGFNEIEYVTARGVRMSRYEVRDGPGIARQEFSVGSAGELVLNLANDFSGGALVLS